MLCTEHTVYYPFEFDHDELEHLLAMASNAYLMANTDSSMEYYAESLLKKFEKALYPE